jgi:sulfur-oxidizing protein SoxY
MKRRNFLALVTMTVSSLSAIDFRETKPYAWNESKLNDAALELYGKELFSTLQKTNRIDIDAPKYMISKSWEIPINLKSDIEAKSVAIFQTGNQQSLVAVFSIGKGMIINYGLNIWMELTGTLFVVVEGVDGKLYYARQFLDISKMSCMAGG